MSEIDVYKELKANLLATRKDLVLNPGSAINDIFLGPTSYIINKNRVLLGYVTSMQSFIDILALLDDQERLAEIALVQNMTVDQVVAQISTLIDNIGANYGVTRRIAQQATGYASFGRFDTPTFTITIPVGTKVKTLDDKEYETTSQVIMGTTNPGQYYDPVENLYLVAAPVKAVAEGIIGNCASYAINTLVSQVAGIQYVLNKNDINNGVDAETNEQFIARIKAKILGNNFATVNGIKSLILENFPTVKDAIVIDANDPLMTRDEGYGGKTDVYVLEETAATTITENHTEYNVKLGSFDGFYLFNQPVESVVTSINFQQDTTSLLAYSNFARSLVYYDAPTPTLPQDVTITYFKICQDIFNFLMQPEYKIAGWSDGSQYPTDVAVLVKKAKQNSLNMSFDLYAKSGSDPFALAPSVESAIVEYLSTLILGEKVAQSDITALVEQIPGVDYLDFSVFDLDGTDLKNVVTVIVTEYIRAGTITITPTV